MNQNTLLTSIKKLAVFALPLSTSALINMISSFISMFMVAKLGAVELAAAALSITTFITVTMVMPIFYAIGILISHFRGQQKSPIEIGEIVKNGFWLAVMIAIPSCFLLWHMDSVLLWFGQETQLINLARGYFHFAAFSMFPMLIGVVVGQFFSAIGYPRYNLIVSLISLPATILLAYGFILGNFGLNQLGLSGITCANLIVQTAVCFFVLLYLYFNSYTRPYQIFSGRVLPSRALCQKILALGFPIGVQFGGELAAMTIATYIMGSLGVVALAASQVVSQYSMLVVMIVLGVSQAVSMLISEARARQDHDLIRQYLHAAMILLIVFFVFVFALFLLAPTYLIQVFINKNDVNSAELTQLTLSFFAIAGFTLFADGFRNIFSGCLRGMHDSKAPMMIGIACLWLISLPLNYCAAFIFHSGPISLRIGFMTGFVVAAVWLWFRIMKKIALPESVINLNLQKSESFSIVR